MEMNEEDESEFARKKTRGELPVDLPTTDETNESHQVIMDAFGCTSWRKIMTNHGETLVTDWRRRYDTIPHTKKLNVGL